jgi:hypothetical protein
MSITTLTIVTGDPDSRKRLIGEAIADHITAAKGETCAAIAVTQKDQAPVVPVCQLLQRQKPTRAERHHSGLIKRPPRRVDAAMARPLRPSAIQDPHHQRGVSQMTETERAIHLIDVMLEQEPWRSEWGSRTALIVAPNAAGAQSSAGGI